METYDLIELLNNQSFKKRPLVLTIGVFDGVHPGHEAIMKELNRKKAEYNASSLVITFSNNPKPESEGDLVTLRQRLRLLERVGVDITAVIDFSGQFSKITASEFIDMLLTLDGLRCVVVGFDFKFGNPSSQATAYDLSSIFLKRGRDVEVVIIDRILTEGGDKISSTLLRRLVKKGNLEEYSSVSGQLYVLDLTSCAYRANNEELIIGKESVKQILPPLGRYSVEVLYSSGERRRAELSITEDSLILKPRGNDTKDRLDSSQIYSLYFGEKKW